MHRERNFAPQLLLHTKHMKKLLTNLLTGLALLAMTIVPANGLAQTKPLSQRPQLGKMLPAAKPLPVRRSETRTIPAMPKAKRAQRNANQPAHYSMRRVDETYKPVFAGCAIYYDTWQADGYGAFQFAAEDESLTTLQLSNALNAEYGGLAYDGKLFVAYQQDLMGATVNVGRIFDLTTWENTMSALQIPDNMLSYAMAQNPVDGKIYGCFYSLGMQSMEFGTADLDNMARTGTIATLPKPWVAMGFTSEGVLYAVDLESNVLRVNLANGETETVGFLGLDFTYRAGGYMDQEHQAFYIEACNDYENAIYQIDMDNFWADYICDAPQQVEMTVMWMGRPMADAAAPAAPQNLSCAFADASLTGTLSFTAPTTTYGGEPLTGALSYTVYLNDEAVATGNSEAGADVELNITAPESGLYVIGVTASNAAGEGAKATVKQRVGYDEPTTVRNIRITRSGNVNTISWDAVKRGANNGYFKADEVTYNVRRLPDNVMVATGVSGTSCTDELEAPEDLVVYTYNVAAVNHDAVGAEGESNNSVPLGAVDLPYVNTFDNWDMFAQCSTINANGDNRYWVWSAKQATYIQYASGEMDDWIVTPGLRVEAGRTYAFSFDCFVEDAACPERLGVYLGYSDEAAGLTEELIAPFEITSTTPQTVSGTFTATQTGVCHVGFHGCSDADQYYLYLDNVRIESGVTDVSPAACQVSLAHDEGGAVSADMTITAPTTQINGQPLSQLSRIEVKNNGQVVKTLSPVAPGQTLTVRLNADEAGYQTYYVSAYNEAGGQGRATKHTIYMGVNYAEGPANATIHEDGNTGNVTLTWDASNRDIDGYEMNPALVAYTIYDRKSSLVGKTDALTYSFSAVSEGQKFVNYLIAPRTERGENLNTPGATALVPVGAPYELPYEESIYQGIMDYAYSQEGNGAWGLMDLTATHSVFEYSPDKKGDEGTLLTGKIAIDNCPQPYLALSLYEYDGSDGEGYTVNTNKLIVEVHDMATGETTELQTLNLNDGLDWVRYLIDMSAFRGKTVQIGFRAVTNIAGYATYIDRLTLRNTPNHDLAVMAVQAPKSAKIGQTIAVSALYENQGCKPAEGYTLQLELNNSPVATTEGSTLAAGEQAVCSFEVNASALMPNQCNLRVSVVYEEDEEEGNNVSPTYMVNIAHSKGAAVNDLHAEATTPNVKLAWTEPSQEGTEPDAFTETWEECESFAVDSAANWTFIDGDGSTTYSLPNEYPNMNKKMAWQVFDNSYTDFGDQLNVVSGTKCLGSFAAYKGPNDDWAISPLLSGAAQTISFYARTLEPNYGYESFELWTSTTGNSRDDFSLMATVEEVPADWTLYNYNLPEGTTYFAIRCTSNDRLMLMLDDVTFAPADFERVVMGYNVFRNGEKLTHEPVAACTFTDETPIDGEASYVVTVVYNTGESLPSNVVTVNVGTGIRSMESQDKYQPVYNLVGQRVSHMSRGVYVKAGKKWMNFEN